MKFLKWFGYGSSFAAGLLFSMSITNPDTLKRLSDKLQWLADLNEADIERRDRKLARMIGDVIAQERASDTIKAS